MEEIGVYCEDWGLKPSFKEGFYFFFATGLIHWLSMTVLRLDYRQTRAYAQSREELLADHEKSFNVCYSSPDLAKRGRS